jgi:hypothetical protein
MDFATDPPVYQRAAYIPADWAGTLKWAVHDGPHDLFGDGAVTMSPTPGHTPGHQSVLVCLPAGKVILVGDAAYHPQKMAERKLPGYLWNPDALIASWEMLAEVRRTHQADLLFSHWPGPGDLPVAPASYRPADGLILGPERTRTATPATIRAMPMAPRQVIRSPNNRCRKRATAAVPAPDQMAYTLPTRICRNASVMNANESPYAHTMATMGHQRFDAVARARN